MKVDAKSGKRAADKLIQKLQAAGFEAWYVGGCVRDFCMREMRDKAEYSAGQEHESVLSVGDIDLTTSATPEEMKTALKEFPIIETGIQHGTVTVLMPANGETNEAGDKRIPFEITTYRSDGEYSDSRHPDSVRFVRNLEEDLARRDFTINAMAMDDKGNIVDPFGGREDLKAGIIRTVGDPDKRFQEDALRIMRALRFAAVLENPVAKYAKAGEPTCGMNSTEGGQPTNWAMQIEPETEAALFRNKELLKNISVERILVEFRKLVMGPNAGIVIRRYVDILGVIIPELLEIKGFEQHNPYHKYDVLEHCVRAMEAIDLIRPQPTAEYSLSADSDSPRDYMKIAALLHDIGKPETFFLDEDGIGHMYGHPAAGERKAREILNRLKADNELTRKVCSLIKHHDLVFQQDEKLLKRWLNRFGAELLLEILEIKKADNIATGNMSEELGRKFDDVRHMIEAIVASQACFSLKHLAINGRDLIDEGITEGKEIGRILETALDAVIDGQIPNKKSELLELARNMQKQPCK